jgi:hypothetical protein
MFAGQIDPVRLYVVQRRISKIVCSFNAADASPYVLTVRFQILSLLLIINYPIIIIFTLLLILFGYTRYFELQLEHLYLYMKHILDTLIC